MSNALAVSFDLTGKVAVLTGAGRGIGLGMARALAGAGAAVAIQDIDESVARQAADDITAAGGKAAGFGGDVLDPQLPKMLIAGVVERFGGIHILVNNASIQSRKHWTEVSADEINRELSANLTSPIMMCQQVAPIFKRQGFGRIINIGSIQQVNGNPTMLAYSLTKIAIDKMTRPLARDLGPDGVTVNCIAPGWIDTYRNRDDFKDASDKKQKGSRLPVRRVGEPSDFGGIAVLLCSDAGSYITGQTIFVDGGMGA